MNNYKNVVRKSRMIGLLFFISLVPLFLSASELEWPQITQQTKPWTRWWWMGNLVNPVDLTTVMVQYQKADLGGLEITPIYGVKGFEDKFIDFLSPEFIEMLTHSVKEGQRLDLGIDMATGTGWPFGGTWIGADDACKNMVFKTYALKGGEKLTEKVTLIQQPLARAVGHRINIEDIRFPISANADLQALALEQIRFEKELPLQLLMAYSADGQTLDLTEKVAENGSLNWVAPEGEWTLYALFQGWHGKMVERAGPGGEGNVIDHFSGTALKNYLKKFDAACTNFENGSIRAYFNDSYEVDDAAGEADWTPNFLAEFQKRRGYDLRLHLTAFLGEEETDKKIRLLCDYRETISDLLLAEFTLPWKKWAHEKGALVRNQAHGSPANILDLYAASDIPETEGTELLRAKFASSAAHVSGKPLTACEASTWLDEHFLSTLAAVKKNVEMYLLAGVNHVVYHGTPYSPPDEPWPGWLFYAAVNFAPSNTWWDDFTALNHYVARCQSFLQAGKPDNDVLLYFPIYDKWSEPGRSRLQHFGGGQHDYDGTSFQTCAQSLSEQGYAYDFISDAQLQHVHFAGNVPETGGVQYQTIVIPACHFMPLATFEKLLELAESGTTICFVDSLPADVPGLAQLEQRQLAFKRLVRQLSFELVKGSALKKAVAGNGAVLVGNDLVQLLARCGIQREEMAVQGLQFIHRNIEDGTIYFVVNQREQSVDGWVPIQKSGASAAIFDPMHRRKGLAATRKTQKGIQEVYLQLEPGESCILKVFTSKVKGDSWPYFELTGEPSAIDGTWTVDFSKGGPNLPKTWKTSELKSWTTWDGAAGEQFSGTAKYSISFQKPEGKTDAWLLDLGEVKESARIILNGQELGTLISAPFRIHIPKKMLKKNNTLEIYVTNLMANRIAEMDRQKVQWKKFYNINFPARLPENRGEDGLFTAAKWPPMDSGLLGPVKLLPLKAQKF